MRVALSERFQRDVRDQGPQARATVFEALLALPAALGDPHTHAGLGIRKLHRSGIWEARVGLGLRLVFALEPSVLTLVRLGSHEDVRRFLREL
jgi:mRNA-degrading endonuclease YafQ of YafQ-DinJ toxin-antitoxin module